MNDREGVRASSVTSTPWGPWTWSLEERSMDYQNKRQCSLRQQIYRIKDNRLSSATAHTQAQLRSPEHTLPCTTSQGFR